MSKLRNSSKESTSMLFNRYVWLVDIIYRSGQITFEDINNQWICSGLNEKEENLPLRTFHNHRKAIEQLFDINIECNKQAGYVYYIENGNDLQRQSVRQWLLNSFSVNNLVRESHKLKHRILLEYIPSGQQFLTSVIEALRDSVTIVMSYQSYWHNEPATFEVEPYCVKLFRQRWYLVAKNNFGNLRIYGLDRVQSLRATKHQFQFPKDFDAENYFTNCFGIINENKKVEVVQIKVWHHGKKNRYFLSLPLHHSQKVIELHDEYTIFEYYLQPTFDFLQEILSHGEEIEVLSPSSLRNNIMNIIKEQVQNYEIIISPENAMV